jgi:hypothetical protein
MKTIALLAAATAAFPAPYAVQGGSGVVGPDGTRYVAVAAGANTRLVAGARSLVLQGAFGVPGLTQDGQMGGLSPDGRTLVLQNMGLHAASSFDVISTSDLSLARRIDLRGTFGFDALSPDGSMLYLIQHQTAQDVQHYVVRAYDLQADRLLPGRIADKAQKSWVMQGWAVARATTPDGRWAYTLYANPGGYPFVHALDTVRGVAHCIGLPWTSDQQPLWNAKLAVHGRALAVGRWFTVDRRTWRVSRP